MADKKTYAEKTEEILVNLPEFVQDFIYGKGVNSSYSTLYEYTRDIDNFFDWILLNHKDFDELIKKDITIRDLNNISSTDINRYLTQTCGDEFSSATRARRKASISVLFSYLVGSRGLSKNPMQGSEKVKLEKKEVIYLTDEEQRKFLDCVYHGTGMTDRQLKHHEHYKLRDYCIYSLLLSSGLRVSELVGLDIRDVDTESLTATVLRKGGNTETIDLSDIDGNLLEMLIEKRKAEGASEEDPLFISSGKERISVRMVEVMTKKYAKLSVPKKANKISPHKMRSSFAMTLYRESGKDLLLVQKRLSHKNITTTNIYAQATRDEVRASRNLNSKGKVNPFA